MLHIILHDIVLLTAFKYNGLICLLIVVLNYVQNKYWLIEIKDKYLMILLRFGMVQ